jgi:MOSC domain-containing protein YiiM
VARSVSSSNYSLLHALLSSPVRSGKIEWIGLRAVRRQPLVEQMSAVLVSGRGVEGDRYETRRNGARQVTLIAREDLSAIASFLGIRSIDPQLLRRNFVTSGINLIALKGKRFRIGDALLETSGECAPCSRMEESFGCGGYNAVRGRGGITARIIKGATVNVGDAIEPVSEEGET